MHHRRKRLCCSNASRRHHQSKKMAQSRCVSQFWLIQILQRCFPLQRDSLALGKFQTASTTTRHSLEFGWHVVRAPIPLQAFTLRCWWLGGWLRYDHPRCYKTPRRWWRIITCPTGYEETTRQFYNIPSQKIRTIGPRRGQLSKLLLLGLKSLI